MKHIGRLQVRRQIGHRVPVASGGYSLLELLIVAAILLSIAAIAYPKIMNTMDRVRLRSAAGDIAGMMQQARIMAARTNATYAVTFASVNGTQSVFINSNPGSTSYPAGAPILNFPNGVVAAAGDPTGSNGQPTPYTLSGDTTGSRFDNSHTVAFTPRGLPCDYVGGTTPVCATPAAGYFAFYLTSGNGSNWAAVVVTRGGRSKVVTWDGSAWH